MRVLIYGKNQQWRKDLIQIIHMSAEQESILEFSTSFSLATYVYDEKKGEIDLIFLQVEGKEDDSIFLAEDIQNYFPHIRVVFYSETPDCAENIFVANPSYFLLVPFQPKHVMEAMHRVRQTLDEETQQSLIIISRGQMQRIRYPMIHYVESIGRKLMIYVQDNVFEINMTMANILEKLPAYFVQCHRSYIVNVNKINKLNGDELIMMDGSYIPVARQRLSEVKNCLK